MELRGVAASGGVGIGKAVRVAPAELDYAHVRPGSPARERERLDRAGEAFLEQTQALARAAREKAGGQQAEILEGQAAMFSDPAMQEKLTGQLEAGKSAEEAVDGACGTFIQLFTATGDELMAQRASDVADLRDRLLALLLGREAPDLGALEPGTVLVVRDLTPSMATALDPNRVAAIVAEEGGYTSHCAILARALGLPAVLGISGALKAIPAGGVVAVDGTEGVAVVEPGPEVLRTYEERRAALLAERESLAGFRNRATETADGKKVRLLGNIGSPGEVQGVRHAGGEGVGLFRTEFLFMDRGELPTEEEQFRAYRAVAEQFPRGEVIIRTLDVGGDKAVPSLGLPREENPFLGFRAVRYCLEEREVFAVQLRALLRASAFGPVKVMVPLVTRLGELRAVRALLEEQKARLDREGAAYDKQLPLGIMVETPAAVLMAEVLAREADFFSIGTNDLTQYTMVADRGNARVAGLCSPFDPAVLRAVRQVITAGHAAGIPVGMCGEAAADARMTPLLVAFGLDEFSVGASSVLSTRREIACWGRREAEKVVARAMELETEEEVKAFLEREVGKK